MNMRAAEAIVSSAPKPMKILPISEVWSQAELLVALAAAAGGASARRGLGGGHRIASRGGGLCLQRAVDIVELIGGNDLGVGRRRDRPA